MCQKWFARCGGFRWEGERRRKFEYQELEVLFDENSYQTLEIN